MDFYLARQRERRGATVAPMHDVCAVVPYVDASLIAYRQARVDIELTGTHTRGMTVCELDASTGSVRTGGRTPNARVAMDIDSRRLIDLVIATLLTYA
jgi:inosine-uridine nucleoside N-ribohydrolase